MEHRLFSIRVLTGAAPLKRGDASRGPLGVRSYPRPHRRGPIEARVRIVTDVHRLGYPRPHRRGPIEATERPEQHPQAPTIRVLTGAAPLKQGIAGYGDTDTTAIRVLTGAAPLKLVGRRGKEYQRVLSASSQARPH